jgi:hypothetical protein
VAKEKENDRTSERKGNKKKCGIKKESSKIDDRVTFRKIKERK